MCALISVHEKKCRDAALLCLFLSELSKKHNSNAYMAETKLSLAFFFFAMFTRASDYS